MFLFSLGQGKKNLCFTGNKVNNIDVVYTPWSNLKKTASMEVGQVGFYNSKMVRFFFSRVYLIRNI